MKEKGTCKKCRKKRVIFYDGLCQTCYKAKPKDKKYIPICDLKDIKNEQHRDIVKTWCDENVPRQDIAVKFGMTKRNVDYIIKKYCKKE